MPTEFEDQSAALVNIIQAVDPDIGRVHNRPRYGDAYDNWIVQVDGIDQVRSWEVGLADDAVRSRRDQAGRTRYRTFEIRGFVSIIDKPVDEAEGPDWDEWVDSGYWVINRLAEQITDAIDTNPSLIDPVTTNPTCIDIEEPCRIENAVPITIGGGFLCWGITIEVTTWTHC